jgi:hypothetical protein
MSSTTEENSEHFEQLDLPMRETVGEMTIETKLNSAKLNSRFFVTLTQFRTSPTETEQNVYNRNQQ